MDAAMFVFIDKQIAQHRFAKVAGVCSRWDATAKLKARGKCTASGSELFVSLPSTYVLG